MLGQDCNLDKCIMWILLFFDLPTYSPTHRKAYAKFRQMLKKNCFRRLQYSVYARRITAKKSSHMVTKMCQLFPKEGDLQIILISDQQYQHYIHIRNSQPIAIPPPQIPLIVW